MLSKNQIATLGRGLTRDQMMATIANSRRCFTCSEVVTKPDYGMKRIRAGGIGMARNRRSRPIPPREPVLPFCMETTVIRCEGFSSERRVFGQRDPWRLELSSPRWRWGSSISCRTVSLIWRIGARQLYNPRGSHDGRENRSW